jgi:hypothetical protein
MLLYQPPWFFVASAAAALPCDLVMGTGDWEAHFITPSLGNWATAVKVSRQLSETNDNDPQNSNILQNAKTIQNCHIDGILVVLCISSHAVLKCSEAELPMFKQLRKLRKLSSWCFLWSVESVHYSVTLLTFPSIPTDFGSCQSGTNSNEFKWSARLRLVVAMSHGVSLRVVIQIAPQDQCMACLQHAMWYNVIQRVNYKLL